MSADTSTTIRLSDAAVRPLHTLDPAAPLDDLRWLDEVVGSARVVAIGESAHFNRESYLVRHRVLRYLVERHGFGALGWESGFVEGWRVDDWLHGASANLDDLLANAISSMMGLWTEMRDLLTWLHEYNRTAERRVGFYGIDLSGSNVSLLPGLDDVIGYFAAVDPEFEIDPGLRETAAIFAADSALSVVPAITAYLELGQDRRDALSAGLAELAARLHGRRLDYLARATVDEYGRAVRALACTMAIDMIGRVTAQGRRGDALYFRDPAIADNVEWLLNRTDRIVLAAHNGHVMRWPLSAFPGMPPSDPMGLHLADRLGDDYRVIGMTAGAGQTLNAGAEFYEGKIFTELQPPEPGCLDALMAASHDGPFAVDLRRLSAADTATVRAVTTQRFGNISGAVSPLDAYDAVIHLPEVTPATPDLAAAAAGPEEIRKMFGQ
ncbi:MULTISPECIES: erythromycin esterase family protein [unclassified Nocardia]|uniref:erythromycin esterase family protein n=1 Tax=unclassified Nocardia TaxID=2637762 RepID=UPI001CE417B0|nr:MULTISPECIES: erythromycin esterase family protein [unclassified Nocardia]